MLGNTGVLYAPTHFVGNAVVASGLYTSNSLLKQSFKDSLKSSAQRILPENTLSFGSYLFDLMQVPQSVLKWSVHHISHLIENGSNPLQDPYFILTTLGHCFDTLTQIEEIDVANPEELISYVRERLDIAKNRKNNNGQNDDEENSSTTSIIDILVPGLQEHALHNKSKHLWEEFKTKLFDTLNQIAIERNITVPDRKIEVEAIRGVLSDLEQKLFNENNKDSKEKIFESNTSSHELFPFCGFRILQDYINRTYDSNHLTNMPAEDVAQICLENGYDQMPPTLNEYLDSWFRREAVKGERVSNLDKIVYKIWENWRPDSQDLELYMRLLKEYCPEIYNSVRIFHSTERQVAGHTFSNVALTYEQKYKALLADRAEYDGLLYEFGELSVERGVGIEQRPVQISDSVLFYRPAFFNTNFFEGWYHAPLIEQFDRIINGVCSSDTDDYMVSYLSLLSYLLQIEITEDMSTSSLWSKITEGLKGIKLQKESFDILNKDKDHDDAAVLYACISMTETPEYQDWLRNELPEKFKIRVGLNNENLSRENDDSADNQTINNQSPFNNQSAFGSVSNTGWYQGLRALISHPDIKIKTLAVKASLRVCEDLCRVGVITLLEAQFKNENNGKNKNSRDSVNAQKTLFSVSEDKKNKGAKNSLQENNLQKNEDKINETKINETKINETLSAVLYYYETSQYINSQQINVPDNNVKTNFNKDAFSKLMKEYLLSDEKDNSISENLFYILELKYKLQSELFRVFPFNNNGFAQSFIWNPNPIPDPGLIQINSQYNQNQSNAKVKEEV